MEKMSWHEIELYVNVDDTWFRNFLQATFNNKNSQTLLNQPWINWQKPSELLIYLFYYHLNVCFTYTPLILREECLVVLKGRFSHTYVLSDSALTQFPSVFLLFSNKNFHITDEGDSDTSNNIYFRRYTF